MVTCQKCRWKDILWQWARTKELARRIRDLIISFQQSNWAAETGAPGSPDLIYSGWEEWAWNVYEREKRGVKVCLWFTEIQLVLLWFTEPSWIKRWSIMWQGGRPGSVGKWYFVEVLHPSQPTKLSLFFVISCKPMHNVYIRDYDSPVSKIAL